MGMRWLAVLSCCRSMYSYEFSVCKYVRNPGKSLSPDYGLIPDGLEFFTKQGQMQPAEPEDRQQGNGAEEQAARDGGETLGVAKYAAGRPTCRTGGKPDEAKQRGQQAEGYKGSGRERNGPSH